MMMQSTNAALLIRIVQHFNSLPGIKTKLTVNKWGGQNHVTLLPSAGQNKEQQ